jgi:hypothetical protein
MNAEAVDKLVGTGESLIRQENSAWSATSAISFTSMSEGSFKGNGTSTGGANSKSDHHDGNHDGERAGHNSSN